MKDIGIIGALCMACGIGALVWVLAIYGAILFWRTELQPIIARIDIVLLLDAGVLLSFINLAYYVFCLALGWKR